MPVELPEPHTVLLDATLDQIIEQRRNWPFLPFDAKPADTVMQEVRAEAHSDPDLVATCQRCVRLTDALTAARIALGRASAAADQAAGAVRGVMLAGGDVSGAERARDAAAAKVEKLRVRVSDLTAASAVAETEATAAGARAMRVAASKRIATATAAHSKAVARVGEIRERFRMDLAKALAKDSETRLVLSRLEAAAGPHGAVESAEPERVGRWSVPS